MRMMSRLKWPGIALLAVGCAVALMACGGGDGDKDGGDGGGEAPGLVAPQPLTPANGTVFKTLLLGGNKYSVDFEWAAVPGATSYLLEISGAGSLPKASVINVPGTQMAWAVGYGDYQWRVWARDANDDSGPASGYFLFSVKSSLTAIPVP